jgi:hypothetical protein
MPDKKLPAKYLKLAEDLAAAHSTALAETADVDDGGTCNFDSPMLSLPRWNRAHVEEAARIAGVGAFQWRGWAGTYWVFCPRVPAQANRRSACSERMYELLKEKGYDASMYYQMD